jgi:hypothetical protein
VVPAEELSPDGCEVAQERAVGAHVPVEADAVPPSLGVSVQMTGRKGRSNLAARIGAGERYDALIVGARPIGSATAINLARTGGFARRLQRCAITRSMTP